MDAAAETAEDWARVAAQAVEKEEGWVVEDWVEAALGVARMARAPLEDWVERGEVWAVPVGMAGGVVVQVALVAAAPTSR